MAAAILKKSKIHHISAAVQAYQACLSVMFYPIRAFRHILAVLDKSTVADTAAASVSSRLFYANSVLYGSPSTCLTRDPSSASDSFY